MNNISVEPQDILDRSAAQEIAIYIRRRADRGHRTTVADVCKRFGLKISDVERIAALVDRDMLIAITDRAFVSDGRSALAAAFVPVDCPDCPTGSKLMIAFTAPELAP